MCNRQLHADVGVTNLSTLVKHASWTSTRLTLFNPPFSQPISINIGQFLALLDLELMKVINRNNAKASYSTMPNTEHNAKMWKNKK